MLENLLRYSTSFMMWGIASFAIHAQEPFRFSETLPLLPPGQGSRTVELPFHNDSADKVVFETHSASCGCTKIIKFPKLTIDPGESIRIPIEIEIGQNNQDLLEVALLIDGVRLVKAGKQKPERVRLAEYKLTIPTSSAPVRLLRRNDSFIVSQGKCSPIALLNASSFVWFEFRAEPSIEGVKANARIDKARIAGLEVQIATLTLSGLESLTGLQKEGKEIPIEFKLFARSTGGEVFIEVGKVSVSLKLLASIELFPHRIDIEDDVDKVKINVVGRAQLLTDFVEDFRVEVDGRDLVPNTEYQVTELSPRWLRFEIARSFLAADHGRTAAEVTITCDRLGWVGTMNAFLTPPNE